MPERQNITAHVTATRKDQEEIISPAREMWGTLRCDKCGAEFLIGPSRIYGALELATVYVQRLEKILAEEHEQSADHQNIYDLGA
jgi:hypothetical protein